MGCKTVALSGMQAEKRGAHDSVIWTLAWHPAGHLLATGSGDTCTKFWGRARPGDPWRDREQREQEENAATEGVGPDAFGVVTSGGVMGGARVARRACLAEGLVAGGEDLEEVCICCCVTLPDVICLLV